MNAIKNALAALTILASASSVALGMTGWAHHDFVRDCHAVGGTVTEATWHGLPTETHCLSEFGMGE